MIKVTIAGATGKMGQELIKLIHAHPDTQLHGGITIADDALNGADSSTIHGGAKTGIILTDNALDAIHGADIVIDFTTPVASLAHARIAASDNIAFVCGTTGFSAEQDALFAHCYAHSAILRAANFSLGVNLLLRAAQQIAANLPDDFDIEILEMHHNQKIDAPSGTALALGKACAAGRGVNHDDAKLPPYDGIGSPRPKGKIGYACLRGGTVAGEHQVIFAGQDEKIILEHQANSRIIFAKGALHGALWLYDKKSGLYSMQDVLADKLPNH